jgi:SAM-dependent methyltransferase
MTDWRGAEWDKWGRTDPYYGVITAPHLRADRIDEKGRADFFRSGELEIAETLAELRRVSELAPAMGRAIDFGCGVGRLTMPLARAFREVIGVDVSPAMLEEARRNCATAGLGNVDLKPSVPGLANIEGTVDFVHSYIVFQHISPAIGYGLFEALLDRLSPTGSGMLHFTFARRAPALRTWVHRARRSSLLVHRAMNLAQRRPFDAPLMAVFEYDVARLLATLEARGFLRIGGRLTDHGGWLGIMLAFSRTSRAV